MPYKEKKMNYFEIMNQATILLWLYAVEHMLDNSYPPEIRYGFGWAVIFFCSSNIMVSLIDMVYCKVRDSHKAIKEMVKYYKSEKKFQKSLETRGLIIQ